MKPYLPPCIECQLTPYSSCGDLSCFVHIQHHEPSCSTGTKLALMKSSRRKGFDSKKHCAYCQGDLPGNVWWQKWYKGKIDYSRNVGDECYACSGRCEIALSDELECAMRCELECAMRWDRNFIKRIQNFWCELDRMTFADYKKECEQRSIKP